MNGKCMKQITWLAVLLLALSACGSAGSSGSTPTAAAPGADTRPPSGDYGHLEPAVLAQMLAQKDFFFVNTHVPYEGEIASTDAFIPYDQTAQRLADYPSDKDARIVVYCRSGSMSAIAAKELVKAGYTNVWDLSGGFNQWKAEGRELLQKDSAPAGTPAS